MDEFRVSAMADSGDFADGDSAALAWDILHRAGRHEVPDVINLADCPHLKPYAVACLCGLGILARNGGRSVRILPPYDVGCAAHLSRLGLLSFFDCDGWPVDFPRDTNITARRVGWPPGGEGERIIDVLAPRLQLPAGMFPRMVECLDEVILNAVTHAESPIDCVVVGQAFPNTQKVEVAVLDFGCTVRGHLTRNPEYSHLQTDSDAIVLALQDTVTGTPAGARNARGEQNSGAGLTLLRDYCVAGGGEFSILSGNAWVSCSSASEQVIGRLFRRFRGCLVNIRYYTSSQNWHPAPAVPIW